MQIHWKVSKYDLLAVSSVCLLGGLILIFYTTTAVDTVRLNPCQTNDSNHNHPGGGGRPMSKRTCVRVSEPSMITANVHPGRLGNQMNLYATLFALGRYNNRKAFMCQRMSEVLSKYFKLTLDTLDRKVYDNTSWTEKRFGGVVDSSIRKLTQPFVRLVGMPQSWKYFHELRPLILNEFRFYDDIVQMSRSRLNEIRVQFDFDERMSVTFVGVHTRRGDYIASARNVGFYLPGMEFYVGAMSYFQKRYTHVIFVIASDDIQWCTENFAKMSDNFRIHVLQSDASDDMVGLDMATLTQSHHLIYGVGTFGFWAGYLNAGQVIFCSDCMTRTAYFLRSRLIYNGDYGNVVLPSWIGYSRNGTKTDRSALARTDDLVD